jgi:HEPN domain-containing protein
VAVEKGTKVVISMNFRVYAKEHSISYERISLVKFPEEFFNSHAWLRQLRIAAAKSPALLRGWFLAWLVG